MIFVNLFNKLYQYGYNYHKIIISNKMTWDEICDEKKKTFISKCNETFDIYKTMKNLYKLIFFVVSNFYYKITFNDLMNDLYLENLLSK